MRVDAHQHFWRLDRGDYHWLVPSYAPLYRDYLPRDLAPHLDRAGVSATILVQAAPTEAETLFLLEIAKATPFVAGVVGWVDLAAPDAPERMQAMKDAGGGYLKGLRPMLQDIADPDWVASPALDRAFDAMVSLGLRFDALVRPVHLGPLLRRLERTPELQTVIDHAAKPAIASGLEQPWIDQMVALASRTSATCKLSGLVTETSGQWCVDDLSPFVEQVVGAFGASRVMWGSDWPVLNLASDYATWQTMAEWLLASLPFPDRALIFGGTAARFYGIENRGQVS